MNYLLPESALNFVKRENFGSNYRLFPQRNFQISHLVVFKFFSRYISWAVNKKNVLEWHFMYDINTKGWKTTERTAPKIISHRIEQALFC